MSLRLEAVVVKRSGVEVIRGVHVDIVRGEFVGLVGSNGSGKSSLMMAMAGLLPLDSGNIHVDGHFVGTEPANRLIGRAIDPQLLPAGLSGRQVLELVANARAGRRAIPVQSVALCDALDLTKHLDTAVGQYSLGMRQKLGIIAGLIDEPPYWLLDESLNGLDPPSAFVLKQHLVAARARGITTILATHGLEIAERQLTRVLVLHDGRVRADWDAARLLAIRADPDASVEAALVAEMAPDLPGLR